VNHAHQRSRPLNSNTPHSISTASSAVSYSGSRRAAGVVSATISDCFFSYTEVFASVCFSRGSVTHRYSHREAPCLLAYGRVDGSLEDQPELEVDHLDVGVEQGVTAIDISVMVSSPEQNPDDTSPRIIRPELH
jgi:hypothetical protein